MSDSHDRKTMIRSAVVLFKKHGVETIIHAGDFISPITFNYMKEIDVPFIGVFGNNDGEKAFLKKRFNMSRPKGLFQKLSRLFKTALLLL